MAACRPGQDAVPGPAPQGQLPRQGVCAGPSVPPGSPRGGRWGQGPQGGLQAQSEAPAQRARERTQSRRTPSHKEPRLSKDLSLSRQEVDSTGLTAGAPSAAEESRGKARKLPLPHRYCLSPWIQLCLKPRVTAGPSSWSVLPQLSGACCLLRFHHLHLNGPGQPRPTPNKPLEVPMERSPPLAWRCRRPQPRSISGKGPLRSSDCRHLPRPHGAPGERVASSLAHGPSSTLRW